MKILHVGWGFRPWLRSSVLNYLDSLVFMQTEHGYRVGYFFAGRNYPFLRHPRLYTWKRGDLVMFEMINSPIAFDSDFGSLVPRAQLNEGHCEELFQRVLSEFNPEIIHFHDLLAFPSSFIEIAKGMSIPTTMTLHDFTLLCPTVKLFDHARSVCLKRNVGKDCVQCCRDAPTKPRLARVLTQRYYLKRFMPSTLHWGLRVVRNWVRTTFAGRGGTLASDQPASRDNVPAGRADLERAFQRRREVNVERLSSIDLLLSNSHRTAEIYQLLGVPAERIVVLHHALQHVDELVFQPMTEVTIPIRFATLSGCSNFAKGCQVILEALRILANMGLSKQFRLDVWGGLAQEIRGDLLAFGNVSYNGPYDLKDLDKVLNGIHVGIVPSVWEETFGHVGIEFLAKGIPVIGNHKGGIIDYTVDRVTGWVNKTCSSQGLAKIMADIIRNPRQVLDLNRNIRANYRHYVKTMKQHFDEIQDVYLRLVVKRPGAASNGALERMAHFRGDIRGGLPGSQRG
jgi:glycosyltransferase involved in cell wall biosynthesis